MRRTLAVSLPGALVIAYGKTATSRLSRLAGLAAKPPVCRTMPSCDETAEQGGEMGSGRRDQRGLEELVERAVHLTAGGAIAAVSAGAACARALARVGLLAGVWR
jgi:hypothetical protein